jgi:hypothetical protein
MSDPELAVVIAQPRLDVAIETLSPALEVLARIWKEDADRFGAWHMRGSQLAVLPSALIHAVPFDG